MPNPDLTVIVVTHNGRRLALETLAAAHTALGNATAEWIVVDCGSSDGTAAAIRAAWPTITVFERANIGFAAGNNVALRVATGRYVLLLNPDVIVTAGTFEDLIRELDARPTVGAASVVQRAPSGELLPSIRRFPSPLRQVAEAVLPSRWRLGGRVQERDVRPQEYLSERPADWLVGAFLAVRRDAITDVGMLDERFFLYSEETDWCFRLRAAGWNVLHLPVMTVHHHQGGYMRPELRAQLAFSKVLFAKKHYPLSTVVMIRAAMALGHSLRLFVACTRAMFQPSWRSDARGQLRALNVALGLKRPTLP